jgi:hypothetical protein
VAVLAQPGQRFARQAQTKNVEIFLGVQLLQVVGDERDVPAGLGDGARALANFLDFYRSGPQVPINSPFRAHQSDRPKQRKCDLRASVDETDARKSLTNSMRIDQKQWWKTVHGVNRRGEVREERGANPRSAKLRWARRALVV